MTKIRLNYGRRVRSGCYTDSQEVFGKSGSKLSGREIKRVCILNETYYERHNGNFDTRKTW